jgi:1-acyl-sn-glycerol-3-phosphate acyltransferase
MTFMRRFVTGMLRLAIRLFFRRIEIVGLEHVPSDAPVIFAANHPNGLVDSLFILCFAPRPVSFLAKAPLFRYPIIGYLVRVLDSIPVYRKQDNTKGSNRETFGRAREVLRSGAWSGWHRRCASSRRSSASCDSILKSSRRGSMSWRCSPCSCCCRSL